MPSEREEHNKIDDKIITSLRMPKKEELNWSGVNLVK
jgi:hypothetical protein